MLRSIVRVCKILLLAAVSIAFILILLLQIEFVQTSIAKRAALWLSARGKCMVEIERVGIDLSGSLFIKGFFISDQQLDTLLYAESIYINDFHPFSQNDPIVIGSIEVNALKFHLSYLDDGTTSNLDFLTEIFDSDDTSSSPNKGLRIQNISLRNSNFKYDDLAYPPSELYGIDWSRLYLSDLNIQVTELYSYDDTLKSNLLEIDFVEKSGFQLRQLSCNPILASNTIDLLGATIKTDQSNIMGDLGFRFQSYEDFYDFENSVIMDHVIDQSNIHLDDIAYFASDLKGLKRDVQIKTRAIGTVNNLRLQKTELATGTETSFLADLSFMQLDNPDSTRYHIFFHRLTTSKNDIEQIEIPPFDSLVQERLALPSTMESLGAINFIGEFEGDYSGFHTFGNFHTNIGTIKADLQLKQTSDTVNYSGNLFAESLNLGKLYENSGLGELTGSFSLNGEGIELSQLDLQMNSVITSLEINKYSLSNINAIGRYRHRNFDGELTINDPNLNLHFLGIADFHDTLPTLDFTAQIDNFNPAITGAISDTAMNGLSAKVKMRSVGLDYRVFSGSLQINDLYFCSRNKDFSINNISITSSRNDSPVLTLQSDLAEGSINGQYLIEEIPASLLDIAAHTLPSLHPEIRPHKQQQFSLQILIKNLAPLTTVFLPELSVAPGTFIKAEIDEIESRFESTISSSNITFSNYSISDLLVDIQQPDSLVYTTISTSKIAVNSGIIMENIAIDSRIDHDTVETSVVWQQSTKTHSGDINFNLVLTSMNNFTIDISKSEIVVLGEIWKLEESGSLQWKESKLFVDGFRLTNANQTLLVDGIASSLPNDTLQILINSIDAKSIQQLLPPDEKIAGVLNAQLKLQQVLSEPLILAHIAVEGLGYNGTNIGNILFDASWDKIKNSVRIDGSINSRNPTQINTFITPLSFSGYYFPNDSIQQIDITANIKALKLNTLNAFLPEESIELQGTARGTLSIQGKLVNPQIQSRIFLERSSIFIHYLNTRYYFSNYLNVYHDMITMDNIPIVDEEGNQGHLTGQLMHENYSKWNFDLMIDFPQPLLLMNTKETTEEPFFGKAYGSGYLGIFGEADKLSYEAQIKTEVGTYLGFPMGTSTEDEYDSFITFKSKSDSPSTADKEDLSGIKLNLGIDITPEAKFELIFDKSVGDVMSGSGKGHIDLGVDQFSNLSMIGGIELTQGNYKFTLKNLINKDFTVSSGGRIDWSGDPLAGNLNIQAIYKVPASLFDLLNDPQYQSGQRVPVNLGLTLQGAMLNPSIDFNIELPTVDQMTKSRVNAVISSDQEKNRQAFALLMLRRFVSPPSVTSDHSSTSALSANGTELLSSQISNWLGQISDDFNLGFNYNPGDDISNEEIALALSTQFFNDRLILSSNFGLSRNSGNSGNTQSSSNMIGDVRIEYKLTPSGQIRLVMYNESNDYRVASIQQSPYTQGLGIIYREDFDNMQQLIDGIRRILKGKSKEDTKS